MYKKFSFSIYLILCFIPFYGQNNINNPVLPGVADAGVMKHNGRYYIGGVYTNGDFFVSKDLVNWEGPVHAVTMNNNWATPYGIGDEQIHANDMRYINGTFHLYWSVNFWSKDKNIVHIAHAESAHPLGPYLETTKDHWLDNRIDPHLFIDDDGRMYLYMVKFTDGNAIWVRPMQSPTVFAGEAHHLISSQPESWETLDNRVIEGACVIKYRDHYYLIYNANHTSTQWGNYMLGVAESTSPLGFNHGNKYAEPVVISNQIELEETFVDLLGSQNEGKFYYSFDSIRDNWDKPDKNIYSWRRGKSGFGYPVTENSTTRKVKTIWNTETCRLYKPFTYNVRKNQNLSMRIHHTGATKIWLNESLIYDNSEADYRHIPIAKANLTDGHNRLAIESRRGQRTNFLDIALFDIKDRQVDDILYTPGQANIVRGPNGFEWWLVYMANKNAEPRGQYINRIHFHGTKLTVDGITGKNTPGYHPVPAEPTYQYLTDNQQLAPLINQPIPSIPSTHYYFEAGIKSVAADSGIDGIIAWQSDKDNWLRITLDASNKKWSYIINRRGEQETHAYPLNENFKFGVFHTLSVLKNHTTFTIQIDNLPAFGQSQIETDFTEKGLPGIYSESLDAEFDGITYTIGWDEYGDDIRGWEYAAETPDLRTKGDYLENYELSMQINASESSSTYPIHIDSKNYLKLYFDKLQTQLIISCKNEDKQTFEQYYSLARLKDCYVNNIYSDFMERHFIFDTPLTLNGLLLKKASIHQNDTLIENIHEKFHIYYTKDGNWEPLNEAKWVAWEHPGFSRLEFSPIETNELIFVKKPFEDEILDLSLQKIKISELYKQEYNIRTVKNKDWIRIFVDGDQVCEIPNNFPKSRVGIQSKAGEYLKSSTLFQLSEQ